MSQKYLIRIAELERLLSEQAEALRQKDQQLSLVEETEAFLRSALTRAEEKIEEDEREIEHLFAIVVRYRHTFPVKYTAWSQKKAVARSVAVSWIIWGKSALNSCHCEQCPESDPHRTGWRVRPVTVLLK
ncbi:hypothetical protein EIMP300_65190 [Escherichia coli]|uniref:Transposase n=1 Tax=Escherichia coli TaxID=562 RepID=A0A8S0FYH4_ECOLX|nr:hypothetical protein EIMP300_65190 [Escherichia coli]